MRSKSKQAKQSLLNYPQAQLPKEPSAEVGKLINVLGGPFFRMSGQFATREFLSRAVRFDANHKWPAAKVPDGAIVLRCEKDAFTDQEADKYGWDINAEYQMNLHEWQRHRMVYMSKHPQETLTDNTATDDAQNQQAIEGAATKTPVTNRKRSKVYQHLDTLDPNAFGGHTHSCKICGALLKQHASSTDKLLVHFEKCHEEVWKDILRSSAHTKKVFDEKGNIVGTKYSFAEALPHHVRFVLWLVTNLRPFRTNVEDNFREFCHGLNMRSAPPPPARPHLIAAVVQVYSTCMGNHSQNLELPVRADQGQPASRAASSKT